MQVIRPVRRSARRPAAFRDASRLFPQTGYLTALNAVATSLGQSLDVETTLNMALDQTLAILGLQAGGISLIDDKTGELVVRIHRGWHQPARVSTVRLKPEDSWLGQVIAGNQVWVTSDRRMLSHLTEFGWGNVQSVAVAPMRAHGKTIGLLWGSSDQPHPFSANDLKLLTAIADQAGIALENARLYQDTCRRLEELTALHEIALAATFTLDLDEAIQRIVRALQHNLAFDYVGLFLVNEVERVAELYATSGLEGERGRNVRIPFGQGIVGNAVAAARPLRVGNVEREPRYLPGISETRSEMAVPLIVGGRVIGAIDVQSPRIDAFTSEDERVLVTVAGQLAIIVQNARLYAETRQRLAHATILYTVAQQLNTSLDVNIVLDAIVTVLKQMLRCRATNIWLLDPETQELEIRAAAGLQTRWKREARLKIGEGIAGQVAATGQPIYVPDTHQIDFIFFDHTVRSLLCVPLIIRERVIGVLAIDSDRPNAFTADDELLLTIVAAQSSIALDNARLFEQVTERARKLEQAYRDLQEVARLRDELIQNVSHELRTPLTFIKGYIELLLEGEMGAMNDLQRKSLGIVADKTNTVARLLNDIIFLQQIERESLELAPLNLGELAQRAQHSFQAQAARSAITLAVNIPDNLPLVMADRDRINQVFDNLIGNAIKFSPNGGQITIRLEEQDNMVQTVISDTGIGIPSHLLEKIFERFYQVDGSSTRRYGGAGLGLAIVKRIVEAHGGRTWAESQLGQGSSFYFTLPKVKT